MYDWKMLAVNYEFCEGHHVRLDDIHEKLLNFSYNSQIQRVLISKNTFSKLILKLFDVQAYLLHQGGLSYSAFNNLRERPGHDVINVTFPIYCTVKIEDNKELCIQCPMESVHNNVQDICEIYLKKQATVFSLLGKDFICECSFPFNQAIVDGFLFLIQQFKLCEGIQNNKEYYSLSGKYTKETVSSITEKENVKFIIRSKSCKLLLNHLSDQVSCEICRDANRKRKRKSNSDQASCDKMEKKVDELHVDADVPQQEVGIQLNEEDHKDMETILENILETGAPEQFRVLLQSQLQNCRKGLAIQKRRWDPKVISVCLGVFIRSPQAYKDLKDSGMLVLPSKRLLQYYKNTVKQQTGFSKENLSWMHKEAKIQKVSDFGMHGGLLIDEMTIQDDLVIKRTGDSWDLVGMVEMGDVNNNIDIICHGGKKVELGTHVLQFVFHGMTGFRWPVAYFGSSTASSHQLYNLFWKCVDNLDEYGFTTDYVMCDGASSNRSFINMLFTGDPSANSYVFKDVFFHQHRICAIQDIMHVFKKIRNNLESSKIEHVSSPGRILTLSNKTIVWDHWVQCYKFNNRFGLQIHHKLTEEHITLTPASKMRNKLAIQVLDKDMLYLMKNYQATLQKHAADELESSIQLLEHTSVLTEIFCNINQPISDIADSRIGSLNNVLDFFKSWEKNICESELGTEKKHLITRETRADITSSILGFISLCKLMLGNGNSINPGFMNSDLIENLFGQQRGIRQGLNTNPTLSQYGPANTAIILGQCSVSSKANSGKKASFYSATTPCPLNPSRNKKSRPLRL